MDYTVHGILQARILEWVAFPFSRGSSQLRDQMQVFLIAVDSVPAEPQGKGWSPASIFWGRSNSRPGPTCYLVWSLPGEGRGRGPAHLPRTTWVPGREEAARAGEEPRGNDSRVIKWVFK